MNDNEIALLSDERIDVVNEQLRLIQKKQGLTFGTDAFLLAAYIRRTPRAKAIELGSGTGIISLLLASRAKLGHLWAVEIQPAFADLIARNITVNGFEEEITPLCADLRELSPTQFGGEVDLVFSNPPYMRCDSGKRNLADEKYIARHEVCGTIADFCKTAARLLRYGGKFVTVWRPDRLTDLLNALHENGLEPKRMTLVYADANAEPCMVLTEAVKGAAPSLRVSAPLLLYEPMDDTGAPRRLTATAEEIYRTCAFD